MMRIVILSLGVLLMMSPAVWADEDDDDSGSAPVFMTRNLYIGANVFRILAVPPDQIPIAAAGILQTILQTNFPERAQALADEIAETRPHLIGLQETWLIRFQSPGDFLVGNPNPAQDVLFDYLQILLNALAARGLDYRVAAIVQNADVEVPVLVGVDGGRPLFDDIRVTDHDVILARRDVRTSRPVGQNFSVNVVFPLGPFDIPFLRGFTAVNAWIGDSRFRFVNTHLETQGFPQVQALQAQELIGLLENERLPLVVVGDLNSSPEDPQSQPYALFASAGYDDAWLERLGRPDPGFTCCHDEDLRNQVAELDERIDHILLRLNRSRDDDDDDEPTVLATVLGDEPGDRTPSGLWPSDHAGVVAILCSDDACEGMLRQTFVP